MAGPPKPRPKVEAPPSREWWADLDAAGRELERRTWLEPMRADYTERLAILEANGVRDAERHAFACVMRERLAKEAALAR